MSADRRATLQLTATALLFCIIVILCNARIHHAFYERSGFWPDPANGMLHYAKTYGDYQKHGKMRALNSGLKSIHQSPVSATLLLYVAPGVLRHPLAPLFWNGPLFFIFVLLLGRLVFTLSQNVLLGCSAIALYSTSLVLFAPYFGITFHIPDTAPGYLLGIAGICFMHWQDSGRLKWVVFFSVAISLSVLLRYVTSVYTFVVFAPLLLLHAINAIRNKQNLQRSVLVPYGIMLAVVALLCGWYIVRGFSHFFSYYSYWGENVQGTSGVGLTKSFLTTTKSLMGFLGLLHLILLCFLLAAVIIPPSSHKLTIKWRYLWLTFAIPFFLVVYYQSDGTKVTSAFLCCFPLIFTGLFGAFRRIISPNRVIPILSLLFVVGCGASAYRSFHKAQLLIRDDPYKPLLRGFAQKIDSGSVECPVIISPQNQSMANALALELFYRHGMCVGTVPGTKTMQGTITASAIRNHLLTSEGKHANYLLLTTIDERFNTVQSDNLTRLQRLELARKGALVADSAWNTAHTVKSELLDLSRFEPGH